MDTTINFSEVLKEIDKLKPIFDAINNNKENIALFGAGRASSAVKEYLKTKGFIIKCFIDNNPSKIGQNIDGIPIVSANSPSTKDVSAIIITVKSYVKEIKTQLSEFSCLSFDEWFMIENTEKYQEIRDHYFEDLKSKKVLDTLMLAVLKGDDSYYLEIAEPEQYFALTPFLNSGKESFVDIGSYVGDAVEKFIWTNCGSYEHIYVFEPGVKQFKSLQKRISRLIDEWCLDENSISLIQAGAAEKNGKASFNSTGETVLQSTNLDFCEDNTANAIQVFSLDSKLENKKISFIKADIEGMEVSMLKGAENLIKTNRPKLAICTYHNAADLIDIIDILKNLVPEYKYALRHHAVNSSETVLYCWI